jgi:hypothetical protein
VAHVGGHHSEGKPLGVGQDQIIPSGRGRDPVGQVIQPGPRLDPACRPKWALGAGAFGWAGGLRRCGPHALDPEIELAHDPVDLGLEIVVTV